MVKWLTIDLQTFFSCVADALQSDVHQRQNSAGSTGGGSDEWNNSVILGEISVANHCPSIHFKTSP